MSAKTLDGVVSVRVLGDLALHVGAAPVALPDSLRSRALLGWLAINPGPHPRREVAAALWPDVPDASARQSVRSALWSLRRALGVHADTVLDTSRDRIALCNVDVDLWRFEDLVDRDRLDEALAVAAGELLVGLDEEWALVARDEYRDRVIRLLAALSEKAAADGDTVTALERARQAVALNPLSESCARLLMCRLEESGDRPVALAVYTKLVDRLRRELRIAPSEETWRLAEKIRNSRPVQQAASAPERQRRPMSQGPLVGRAGERQQLLAAWHSAKAGQGGLAVVHGEAGIGKTRLVTDLAETAATEGALTAIGAATNLGAPFSPWADLARAIVHGIGGVPDGELFTTALAPLLPTMIAPTTPGPPQLEAARLTEGLLALIEYAASRGPLLAILEDIHDCDDSSAAVLARAGRRLCGMPVLIVWTRRDRPIRPALADAEHRTRHLQIPLTEVPLGRLDPRSIAELAGAIGPLTDDDLECVVSASDGNALLAVESTRTLLIGGRSLPEGLRGTIRARTANLPGNAQDLCATLAVAGRFLTVEELRRRLPELVPDARLDDAVRLAEDAGLVGITGRRLDFCHALLRDAYYAELPELERARTHAAAALDLAETGGPERSGEAAQHSKRAGDRAGAGRLLIQAAAHARSLGAFERAHELLVEAADLLPNDADIPMALAEVSAYRGRRQDFDRHFETAVRMTESGGDRVAVVRAHIRCAEWNTGPLCRPRLALRSLRTALEVLDRAAEPPREMRVHLLASLAWCEAVAGDADACDELIAQASARQVGIPEDPLLAVRIGNARSLVLLRRGRFTEAAEPARHGAAIARSIGRTDLVYLALLNAAAGLAAGGYHDAALDVLDEALDAEEQQSSSALAAEMLMSRAWVLSRLARHDDALRDTLAARRLADSLGTKELCARADAEIGRALLRAGSYEDAEARLLRALDVTSASICRPLARLQRAEALARLGRHDESEAEVRATALEPVRAGDWPDMLVARMSSVRGLIAAGRGDVERARTEFGRAENGWRRRTAPIDLGDRLVATIADFGRPVIGLISPAEELRSVRADLAALDHDAPIYDNQQGVNNADLR